MLEIEYTSQFKKDLKLIRRRNKDIKRLEKVMLDIQYERPLAQSLKDHPLKGNWANHRECHLEPDWLLIYKLLKSEPIVVFTRTGSHSDLFR